MKEKYSVLMSVYIKENPEYLKLSIESMIKQSLEPNQIVIVKDGKLTNELNGVLDYYERTYPTLFTVVSLNENQGLGLALNAGLKACKNDLFARMDSDDISLRDRCELQVEQFSLNKNLDIVGTMINEFHDSVDNIVSSRVVPTAHFEIVKFSRRRSPFNHPTVMYKKSVVLKFGGYRNVKRKEDIELFVRMLNNGCIGMNIDKALLLYRSNEENFARRKEWQNCQSYISVVFGFWKKGYSKTSDLLIVIIGQLIMYLSPLWMLKILSNSYLRKKKHSL